VLNVQDMGRAVEFWYPDGNEFCVINHVALWRRGSGLVSP
jgi:hypothetical protein